MGYLNIYPLFDTNTDMNGGKVYIQQLLKKGCYDENKYKLKCKMYGLTS